jgi:hypothetical protein
LSHFNSKIGEIQNEIHEYNKCDICNRVFVNKFQWQCHLNGAPHKKRLESKRRKELRSLADQLKSFAAQSHSNPEENLTDIQQQQQQKTK